MAKKKCDLDFPNWPVPSLDAVIYLLGSTTSQLGPFRWAQPEQQQSLEEHSKTPACKSQHFLVVIYANSKEFSQLK